MLEQFSKEWVEIGALIVAIVVAWIGLRAGKEAEKSAEAQLDAVHATVISQAIDEYQKLGRDMETLVHWYEEVGDNFVNIYINDPEGVDHVSGPRTNVRLYFQKCAQLLSAGTITPKVFRTIANKSGLNILHRIVIPIERAKKGDADFFESNPEMKIYEAEYKKFGDGPFTFERLVRRNNSGKKLVREAA